MHLVAVAWIYVVLMMGIVEAMSTNGTVIGAIFTVLLYGALPLGIVLYVMGTPGRKAQRRAREAAELAALSGATAEAATSVTEAASPADTTAAPSAPLLHMAASEAAPGSAGLPPDGRGQAAGAHVAPK